MKTLIVKGTERTLLDGDDKCPICGAGRDMMVFSWNMFHGEATSACCGAVYQLKDYHISDPTEEETEFLKELRGDFIEFKIKNDWVEPLKQAIAKTGITDINNSLVYEEAKLIMEEA